MGRAPLDKPLHFIIDQLETPIGTAQLVSDEEGCLRVFGWYDREERWWPQLCAQYGDVKLVEKRDPFGLTSAVDAYMAGEVHAIDAVPVAFEGTPFQKKVWHALRTIPAGETLSYGALAKRINEPKAVRAVGLANGANPIAVVVPCHRVIGSNGSLTGYGGGLERKRWLLTHEAKHAGGGLFRKEASI
ncbi:MAG: methylated-DNA--[protein]-cysteine S-methyltransferase [Alphaproteobacteria bacterium]|nr:methylated-DNA--[protein]-cysteine S-methyltransferase [Alphaproteobacteria bacterium]MDE1986217.1 methylated-DNA--[protein]-cysteine S-methyltransferase [Alphaproteobacteria bacterium]MDE2163319.1 methylated-DNA--[protein]-cysteine S-methyltransferase [Alphaproteobacteria bacterium]MDE2264638.1 methylated-DNA--[protein]-cysteine S-methyltransferase [Alphaproteobacteria bacterium]MDE2499942.1 methylated-DNA--[protein]-cysteine S-methyltransferase [Alphaproteobacteria bacterium]